MPFPHLRDLFRPDARNFPRHHEVGVGDVRRIFAFDFAQICAVQISGVIIEKSRRSCCFRCSPWLVTSFHLEKFHETKRMCVYFFIIFIYSPTCADGAEGAVTDCDFLFIFILATLTWTAQSGAVSGNSRATCTKTYTSESVAAHGAAMRRPKHKRRRVKKNAPPLKQTKKIRYF